MVCSLRLAEKASDSNPLAPAKAPITPQVWDTAVKFVSLLLLHTGDGNPQEFMCSIIFADCCWIYTVSLLPQFLMSTYFM